MKPDVVLINTARGAVVDEDALVAIARERPEMRIALDAFTVEPLPVDSPLRTLPNAILTPHIVGQTREMMRALPRATIDNVTCALAGEPPPYVRNRSVLPAWTARFGKRERQGAGAAAST